MKEEMEFLKHKPSEFHTSYLLKQYGELANLSGEMYIFTNRPRTMYRFRPVKGTPGVWISETNARSKLEEECRKHQDRLRNPNKTSQERDTLPVQLKSFDLISDIHLIIYASNLKK
jgi:hypothetical protein